jgi:hypothetical protein
MGRPLTLTCLVVLGLGALSAACGGRGADSADARPDAGSPQDAAPAPAVDAQEPPADVQADVSFEPDVVFDVRPDTGTSVDAPADEDVQSCSLSCADGPCPTRDGGAIVVVASNMRPPEHVASVAAGGGEVFIGTISSDIFHLGRLVDLSLASGQTTMLDAEVQASRLLLDGGLLFYVGDAVQSSAQQLYSVPLRGGARTTWVTNDGPFGGVGTWSVGLPASRVFFATSSSPSTFLSYESGDNLSSGAINLSVVPGAIDGLAVDAENIYFVSSDHSLQRHQWAEFLDESEVLATSPDALGQPVVAGTDLYFVHQHAAGDCAGSVATMPTKGGMPRQVSLGNSGSDVSSLAVDDAFVYWTTFDDGGVVFRAPRAGGTPEILASGQREARGVTFDETRVYWIVTDATGGQVRAVAK